MAKYGYAFDVSTLVSTECFEEFKKLGYSVAFVRVYSSADGGSVDIDGIDTVQHAYDAQIGVELFVTPNAQGEKAGYLQFDEAYTALKDRETIIHSIWLQVTSPAQWRSDSAENREFITSFVDRALVIFQPSVIYKGYQQFDVRPGVYTSAYDWDQITGNWSDIDPSVRLWYWSVLGQGVSGEAQPDFEDFRPFGRWASPDVKQFAQSETVCNTRVNRDIFKIK